VFKAAKLLTCIREVSGSIICPATLTVLTEVFRGLPRPSQANCGVVPQIMPQSVPLTFFPSNHSLIILPFDAVVLVINSVAKQTAN
jgi:hypothetical protein